MSLLDPFLSPQELRERAVAHMAAADAFPVPLEGARDISPADAPQSPRLLHARALASGWAARLTRARGYLPDKDWQPRRAVVREPVVGEDGTPVMTEPTKRFPAGQPKTRQVPGDPVVVESIALRAIRDGRGVAAVWHLRPDGWALAGAWASHPLRPLTFPELQEVLGAPG